MEKDSMLRYQREVKEHVIKCNTTINKTNKFKCIQMNPKAPQLNALIKVHKQTQPIRPVVNCRCVPTCKIAKTIPKWLEI
jgi:hypothetical protein